MCYGYDDLIKDIKALSAGGARVGTAGKSLFGRNIWYAIAGSGFSGAMIFGAIHAREHITAKLVSDLAKNYRGRGVLFVPMANPDGVELCKRGVTSAPENVRKNLLRLNGSDDFRAWKANGRAVDLNVNFDAGFGKGEKNRFSPAPENYVGPYPESEPESKALLSLAKRFSVEKALCYHAKGEVIYYGYENGEEDYPAAKTLSDLTGYVPLRSDGSHGGFKDYFIKTGKKALTVEVGSDEKSYVGLYDEYDKIYRQNRPALAAFTEKIWTKNT